MRLSSVAARLVAFVVLAMLSLVAGIARADAGAGVASFVGAQPSGLPGFGRVGVASDSPTGLTGAAEAGYGFTEAQAGDAGGHHRAMGTLGVAVQPLRFFAAALRLDGRLDTHPADALGSSSTSVGAPSLVARAAQGVSRSVAIGAELGLLVPGAEAPSLRPSGSTLDAKLLFTFAPPGTDLALAMNAGYRLDRSQEVVDDADRPRLRPGDRLTLGLSDFDAILLGAGAGKRFGRLEVLGELTWDVLVGSGAPSAVDSPLRIGGGGRYHVGDAQLELRAEVDVGGRPASGPRDAFVPIEPRFAALAGVRWNLPFEKSPPPVAETKPSPVTTPPPVAPPVTVGSIQGRVTTDKGEPIAGARVTVTLPSGERVVMTGSDGAFRVDDVPPGPVRIVVNAPGYEDAVADTNVEGHATAAVPALAMKPAIKPGQLRGLVRSFGGKPLAATIRVEPLGLEAKTDADGTFQIDVPPGAYEVVVAAPGYAGQRRPVQVEENGVTVLNADLRPGKP